MFNQVESVYKYTIAANATKILHGENKNKNCKLRKGLTRINEQIKALRCLTYWLFTLFMSSLFGSGDLTIIKRRFIVWWLLIVYCFAGNQADPPPPAVPVNSI